MIMVTAATASLRKISASGAYFVSMETEGFFEVKKLLKIDGE
jgi:hypothetical protein